LGGVFFLPLARRNVGFSMQNDSFSVRIFVNSLPFACSFGKKIPLFSNRFFPLGFGFQRERNTLTSGAPIRWVFEYFFGRSFLHCFPNIRTRLIVFRDGPLDLYYLF